MNKTKMLRARLEPEEWAILEAFAERKKISVAQVIRNYVQRLPDYRFDRGKATDKDD